jgi:hypothetical protein
VMQPGGDRRRRTGSIGTRLRGALAAGALLVVALAWPTAGGSRSTPVADPCAGTFRSAGEYQEAFAGLASLGTGWSTADGYVPVALPDGRTAWLMSDTLLAPPAVPAGAPPTFVHNSIVVQHGRCLAPVLGGTVAGRQDLVPEVYGRACWPSSGVARGRTMLVFCTLVEQTDGPPGFGFRVVGTAIASFALPNLTFRRLTVLPFGEPAGISWGTGAVLVDRTVYVYGAAAGNGYVARAEFARATTGPWRFWAGRTWGRRAALGAMTFRGGPPTRPSFVTRSGAGFVAVAFPRPFPDPEIAGWTAARPEGPWRARGPLTTAVVSPAQFAYDARAVDLRGAGWTIVYNVNDPVAVATDPTVYGGRFVRPTRRGQGARNWWRTG